MKGLAFVGAVRQNRALNMVNTGISKPFIHGPIVGVLLYAYGDHLGFTSGTGYLIAVVLTYGIAALGLDFSVGFLGQISLGQGALFGVGAYATAILSVRDGWGVVPSAIASTLIGLALGVLLGIPAARLGAIGFGIVSLGYTLVFGDLVIALPQGLTGGTSGISGVVGSLFGRGSISAGGLFIIATTVFVATYVLHWYVRAAAMGRNAIAIKDDDLGAAGLGLPIASYRIAGFAVCSALGALGGSIFAQVSSVVVPSQFVLQLSLLMLLMVVFGGAGTQVGPLIGIAVVGAIPTWLSVSHGGLEPYIYGAMLILVVRFLPRGIVGVGSVSTSGAMRIVRKVLRPAGDEFDASNSSDLRGQEVNSTSSKETTSDREGLFARDVRRSFGGVVALDSVSIEVLPGQIYGIVGPNGSGKTTLVNVIQGFYPPERGHLEFWGTIPSRINPQSMAKLGVSRTYQIPKMFPTLSVGEHLALTIKCRYGDVQPLMASEIERILKRATLSDKLDRSVKGLSHGQLRLLEIAMAVLRGPRLLLMDEPAAGLTGPDMDILSEVIRTAARLRIGVVVVEHHLDWVRSISDRVSVMADGKMLWTGAPGDMHLDEDVRAAYLGEATDK